MEISGNSSELRLYRSHHRGSAKAWNHGPRIASEIVAGRRLVSGITAAAGEGETQGRPAARGRRVLFSARGVIPYNAVGRPPFPLDSRSRRAGWIIWRGNDAIIEIKASQAHLHHVGVTLAGMPSSIRVPRSRHYYRLFLLSFKGVPARFKRSTGSCGTAA